jgi:hypothetical protein
MIWIFVLCLLSVNAYAAINITTNPTPINGSIISNNLVDFNIVFNSTLNGNITLYINNVNSAYRTFLAGENNVTDSININSNTNITYYYKILSSSDTKYSNNITIFIIGKTLRTNLSYYRPSRSIRTYVTTSLMSGEVKYYKLANTTTYGMNTSFYYAEDFEDGAVDGNWTTALCGGGDCTAGIVSTSIIGGNKSYKLYNDGYGLGESYVYKELYRNEVGQHNVSIEYDMYDTNTISDAGSNSPKLLFSSHSKWSSSQTIAGLSWKMFNTTKSKLYTIYNSETLVGYRNLSIVENNINTILANGIFRFSLGASDTNINLYLNIYNTSNMNEVFNDSYYYDKTGNVFSGGDVPKARVGIGISNGDGHIAETLYLDNYVERNWYPNVEASITPVNDYYYIRIKNNENVPIVNYPVMLLLERSVFQDQNLSVNEIGSINFVVSNQLPTAQTQFNYSNVNFSASVLANFPFNASLIIDGVEKNRQDYSDGLNDINLNYSFPTTGYYTYYFNLTDNESAFTTTPTIIFIDISKPQINNVTFINNSIIKYRTNITSFFSFSDDFALYYYNISIDNTQLAYNGSLGGATYTNYSLNYNTSSLSTSKHTLTVEVADGHTTNEISDYGVSTGLFGDYIRFENNGDWVQILPTPNSIWDDFSFEKKTDRYSWTYKPNEIKENYTFIVGSNRFIDIIDKPDYPSWLIVNDKWIDFNLVNEPNEIITFTRLTDTDIQVDITGITNPEEQIYNSIGGLNIITNNYTFYTYTDQVSTPLEPIDELNYDYFNLTINKSSEQTTTALFNYNNINYTPTFTNLSTYDFYNITIISPTVISKTSFNLSWTYNLSSPDNTSITNTMNNSQNVTPYLMTNCTGTVTKLGINFSVIDIDTSLAVDNLRMNGAFTINPTGEANQTKTFNLVAATGAGNNTFGICINTNKTIPLSWLFDYHTINSGYSVGSAADITTISNATSTNYEISLMQAGSTATVKTLDQLSTALIGYLVKFYLITPSKPDVLARSFITDYQGAGIIQYNPIKTYRFDIYDSENNLVHTTGNTNIIANPTIITVVFANATNFVPTPDVSLNLVFDAPTQTGTLHYHSRTSKTNNINLTTFINDGVYNTSVCSNSQVGISGSVSCTIPPVYTNGSFLITVFNNGTFIGSRVISIQTSLFTGSEIMMTAMFYSTLVGMALSSSTGAIIFGLLGLLIPVLLGVINGGSIIGVGSGILWVLIAGIIMIMKLRGKVE